MQTTNTITRNVLNICIFLGAAVPYTALAIFLSKHGLNLALLIEQIFGSPGATFFTLDVLLTALFVIGLALTDRSLENKKYLVIATSVLVGPSCALPLYYRLK